VFFIARIRDEKKFDSVNELKTQIKSDMKEAREYFDLDED
jgi:FAD synthase